MKNAHWLLPGSRLVFRALALVGLLFALICATPFTGWWTRAVAGPWDNSTCHVLVVPAGSHLSNDILGYSSYWRAVYAVLAWRRQRYEEVLLSGGGSPVPAAEAMRNFLIASGVPRQSIRVETESTSTRENALNSARMLSGRQGCVTLLTSDFHMFRAYRSFRKAGLDVRPTPIPDAAKSASRWHTRWSAFLLLAEETAKILYYGVRGWI